MMTPMEFSDRLFQIWYESGARYLESLKESRDVQALWGTNLERLLQFKIVSDQIIEESMKAFHLPSSGDMTRLRERINDLELHLAEMRDLVEERMEQPGDSPQSLEPCLEFLAAWIKRNAPAEQGEATTEAIELIEKLRKTLPRLSMESSPRDTASNTD